MAEKSKQHKIAQKVGNKISKKIGTDRNRPPTAVLNEARRHLLQNATKSLGPCQPDATRRRDLPSCGLSPLLPLECRTTPHPPPRGASCPRGTSVKSRSCDLQPLLRPWRDQPPSTDFLENFQTSDFSKKKFSNLRFSPKSDFLHKQALKK